jgi:hypothetical protein
MSLQDVIPDSNKARSPEPFWGEEDVYTNATLKWKPAEGIDTNGNQVYFGTDEEAVRNATTSDTSGIYKGAQDANEYSPQNLVAGQRYYWRVDSVVSGSVQTGYIWDFWTFTEVGIDDFESYADTTAMKNVWEDWTTNDSGATVELETEDSHTGSNSIEYLYESQYGDSIASIDYGTARKDWSLDDELVVMDIWFKGTSNNTTDEDKFITLYDSDSEDTVTYPDSADLAVEEWQVWRINMSEFDNVDLTDIRKFTIGFTNGQAAGSGFMYFDDIAVYPCRPGSLSADINQDCKVDFADFAVISEEWLQEKLY